MSDLKLEMGDIGFDLQIDNDQFVFVDGFDTNISVSLFTDSRASASDIPKPLFRRGWMLNQLGVDREFEIGGLLWLFDQNRLTTQTRNNIVDAANKSLQWLLDRNIASAIDIEGTIIPKRGIALTIEITYTNGVTESQYIELWEVTGA